MFVSDMLLNDLADEAEMQEEGIVLVDSDRTTIVADMTATSDTVSWDKNEVGKLDLSADITYSITAGSTIAGWRAIDSGGNLIFGADFDTAETYSNDGEFLLEAIGTYFQIQLVI
jgi:hypothetical protein